MTEAQTVLSIEGLHVAYGSVQAIENVSLVVNRGEAVALIGANGAGKSTLFKAAIGLVRPRSGHIALDGRALNRISARGRALLGMGYSPEGRRIFPGLSVRENLEVAVRGGARDRAERLAMAFDLFPALGARQASLGWQLSGGQQQMLAIGRALMGRPRLLLLDEPSMGLSPKLADEVMQAVRRIVGDGTAVLLAEQNVVRSLGCCDRAYVLEIGRIVLSGAADALRESEAVRKAYLGG